MLTWNPFLLLQILTMWVGWIPTMETCSFIISLTFICLYQILKISLIWWTKLLKSVIPYLVTERFTGKHFYQYFICFAFQSMESELQHYKCSFYSMLTSFSCSFILQIFTEHPLYVRHHSKCWEYIKQWDWQRPAFKGLVFQWGREISKQLNT